MKRILHILPSDRFSGAENVVCQIIQMFRGRENDYEMIYCCPDGPIRTALLERNIQFLSLEKMNISELQKAIKKAKPDVIHVHDMKASFLAAIVCGKIPLISHIHNNNFDSRKPTLKAILYLWATVKAKHIFWVSKSSMEEYCFQKWVAEKSSLLTNIIDPVEARVKAEAAENKGNYDIVYVGRLTYPKNPQRVISILKAVTEAIPNVRAAIVGTGELEAETKRAAVELKIDHCIDFLGFVSNPLGIMKNAKLMIMASRWEGTPMCALEAVALGIPIISTPTDGLKQVVIDGETGYLSDDDEVLVEACVQVLENHQLREKLVRQTLWRIDDIMDVDKYVEQVKRAYEQAMQR